MSICYDCLESVKSLIPDKGQFVCQKCFGKRYSWNNKKKLNINPDKPVTIKDLKMLWERSFD